MSIIQILKPCINIIRNHPAMAEWYIRNRLHTAALASDIKRPDSISRFPRGITIRPTLACNLHCKMCAFAANGDVQSVLKESLPLEAWEAFLDDITPSRPYITLTGGEPFLYPHISQLILGIKRRNLICTLTTNGTLLSRHAPAFMSDAPDVLVVSLDGPEEVHDEIRGRAGTYRLALEGIRTVQDLKKEHGQKKPLLVINTSITDFNYRHIESMIDIAHGLGADGLNYQFQWSLTPKMAEMHNKLYGNVHFVSPEGSQELPRPDPAEVVEVVRRIRRRSHASNGRTYISFYPNLNDDEIYRWYDNPHTWIQRKVPACAWMNTNILPNGDVEPCPGLICGNITQERFADIWNNPISREHRKRLSSTKSLPICLRCCAYLRKD